MTPRVSVAGAVCLTTEVLGGTLLLDKHGDQLNLPPPSKFRAFGLLDDDGDLAAAACAIRKGTAR